MTNKKSNYHRNRKNLRKSRSGVSEIIGNLLILAITVSLFSGVLFFVTNMPPPQDQTLGDFSAQTGVSGSNLYMNITHKGGQTLSNAATNIYLFKNGVPSTLYINSSIPSIGTDWNIGEVWSHVTGYNSGMTAILMIVDKTTNNIVWQATLAGGNNGTNTPPIIQGRGLTPSPTYAGVTDVMFYASVFDINGLTNIASVYVNASGLPGIIGASHINLYNTNNNGAYTSASLGKARLDWNGMTVLFIATDKQGLMSTVQFTITVLPSNNNPSGSGTGAPPGNLAYSGLQGFQIFEWTDWNKSKYGATPVTSFTQGQQAVVVVASKYVVNTQNMNSILLMNGTTKQLLSAVSSPINNFAALDVLSGYYIYNCTIDTSLLPAVSSYYTIQITLKDNWVPNNLFTATQTIFVNKVGSTATIYPTFKTYLLGADGNSFGVPSTNFTAFNPSNDLVCVEITTQLGGNWIPNSGIIGLRDFFSDYQLKQSPSSTTSYSLQTDGKMHAQSWNGPVSNVWRTGTNTYRLLINLENITSGVPFLSGNNAYNLVYDVFQAGGESYSLTTVINIISSTSKLDIVAGGSPAGGPRFSAQASLLFYYNDNLWSPPDQLEVSNDKQAWAPTVYYVRAGDINGDGKTDFAAVLANGGAPYYLFGYIQKSSGWDRTLIATLAGEPKDIELGNTGLGSTMDIVVGYGTSANNIVLYKNDGSWTPVIVEPNTKGGVVTGMQVANMESPGTPIYNSNLSQDIVAARSDGTITLYNNQNGIGTVWTSTVSLQSSGNTNVLVHASSEANLANVYFGNYTMTTSSTQNPFIYEGIQESAVYKNTTAMPRTSPADILTDDITQLNKIPGNATNPYTAPAGKSTSIAYWDPTDITTYNALTINSLQLVMSYRTTIGNAGNDSISWKLGSLTGTAPLPSTGDEWNTIKIDLKPYVATTNNLQNLNVTYKNTQTAGNSTDFQFWALNVTWVIGDTFTHVWKFTSIPTTVGITGYQFSVYALRSPSVDGDSMTFWYSYNGGVTYQSLGITVDPAKTEFFKYAATLPLAGFPTNGTILVKAIAPMSATLNANPGYSTLKVGQMHVEAVNVKYSSVGTSVNAIKVADMNGDGYNDLVAIGNSGTVVVFTNTAAKTLFQSPYVISTGKATVTGSTWLGAGQLLGAWHKSYLGKPYLDIAFATSSTVYIINQTSYGIYDVGVTTSLSTGGATIAKMLAVDVDGNGRTDLLLTTTTKSGSLGTVNIYYYANFHGAKSISSWQYNRIDTLSSGSSGFLDMDARKFQNQ